MSAANRSEADQNPLKELFTGTLKYSMGGLAGRAIQLISMPLYLRVLTPREYGIQSIALLNENIFGILAGYAVTNAIGKYYTEARQDSDRQGKVIGTAFWFLGLIGLTFVLMIELLAPWLARWSLDSSAASLRVIRLIGISFFANLFVNLMAAVWQLDQRIALFVWSNMGKQIVSVTVGLLLVVAFSSGVVGVLLGWVVASLILALLSLVWGLKRYRLSYDRQVLVKLLRFGLPMVPAAFLLLLLNGFDRYLLKQMQDLSVVGIYAANFTLAAAANLALVNPFKQMWAPIMWKIRGRPNEAEIHRRTLTYYAVGQIFVLCGLAIFSDLGMRLLSGGRAPYIAGSSIIPVLYFGIALYGTYDVTSAGYFFEARTHFYTITVFFATLLNIGLNYLLIPGFGFRGSAVAYAMSYLLFAVFSYRFGRKFFQVDFEWSRMAKAFVLGLGVTALGWSARTLGGWIGIAAAGVALAAYPGALWAGSFFSLEEQNSLRRLAQRLRYIPRKQNWL